MSAQALLNIVQDEAQKAVLINLIDKQHALNLSQEVVKQEKASINDDVKKLGLKPAEFNKIVKFSKDAGDLLMNELATLEAINDNLVEDK